MEKPITTAQKNQVIAGTLVTAKTASAALAVSLATFWAKFVKTGLVPAIRFGKRCTRFRADDLLALINP